MDKIKRIETQLILRVISKKREPLAQNKCRNVVVTASPGPWL
jgi:hypothetical protein